MIQAIIIGNLTRAPEAHTFGDGSRVCNMDVAVNYYVKGEKKVQYVRVSAYDRNCENCLKYLDTGRKVMVQGFVKARAWPGRDGTPRAALEISAEKVEFLTPAKSEFEEVEDDDDIPFKDER